MSELIGGESESIQRLERKRKWDQPASERLLDQVDPATAAAAAAAAQVSNAIAASSSSANLPSSHDSDKNPQSNLGLERDRSNSERPIRELEINDRPNRRHAISNVKEVEARTGAAIVTRGVYYPPDADPPPPPSIPSTPQDKRKLYFLITGETAEIVDNAIAMLESYLERAGPSRGQHRQGHLVNGDVDRVWCDMDMSTAPGFDVLERLRGPNNEYLAFIEQETGASVELAGRGACLTYTRENLHIAIRAPDPKANAHARSLCLSLVQAIQPVFNEYRAQYFPHLQHRGHRGVTGASRGGAGHGREHSFGTNPIHHSHTVSHYPQNFPPSAFMTSYTPGVSPYQPFAPHANSMPPGMYSQGMTDKQYRVPHQTHDAPGQNGSPSDSLQQQASPFTTIQGPQAASIDPRMWSFHQPHGPVAISQSVGPQSRLSPSVQSDDPPPPPPSPPPPPPPPPPL